MAETFTTIALEVYIGSSWVDLWADVILPVKCTRGIRGNNIEDRVADIGKLSFDLDNSQYNSHALIGYYSPGHANCLSGWTTSLPVRLTFTYDTWTYIKWRGKIEPDGIKVIPGINAERKVKVTCTDYMDLVSNHKINLMTLRTNQYLYEAINYLLTNLPVQPQRKSYVDEVTAAATRIPVVFDTSSTETTAAGEFQKLAMTDHMCIFLRGGNEGETLATGFNNSIDNAYIPIVTASSGKLLKEDGGRLLLENGSFLLLDEVTSCALTGSDLQEGTEVSYGKYLYNYVTVISHPRKTDAAATTVLWTLTQATGLDHGESVTIRGAYRDPNSNASKVNGTAMVTPVSGTDYKANAASDGTGLDMTASLGVSVTFGASEVEFTLTNNHATDRLYFGGDTAGAFLQVRGKGVYTYDTARLISKDATSMATHGVRTYTYDMYYKDAPTSDGKNLGIGDLIIAYHKDPFTLIDKVKMTANESIQMMTYFMFVEPGDSVEVSEAMSAVGAGSFFCVQGYDFDILSKSAVVFTWLLKSSSIF